MDLILGFASTGEAIEVEGIASNHRADECSRRGSNQDIGLIRIPSCRHLNSEQGSEMERCTCDATTTEDESYAAHGRERSNTHQFSGISVPTTAERWRLDSGIIRCRPSCLLSLSRSAVYAERCG
jgi:hypothetical protein